MPHSVLLSKLPFFTRFFIYVLIFYRKYAGKCPFCCKKYIPKLNTSWDRSASAHSSNIYGQVLLTSIGILIIEMFCCWWWYFCFGIAVFWCYCCCCCCWFLLFCFGFAILALSICDWKGWECLHWTYSHNTEGKQIITH